MKRIFHIVSRRPRISWRESMKRAFRPFNPPADTPFILMRTRSFRIFHKANFPVRHWRLNFIAKGAIRGVEIGSVMFAYPDPDSGKMIYPKLELLRLAIPRRTYTQTHMDYVADTLAKIKSHAKQIRGYKFTYAPELLRHFTARFEPL